MRLKYEVVKGLCLLMSRTCIKIRDTKNISVNFKRLKWSDKQMHLTLQDYQFHFNDFFHTPNTLLLDEADLPICNSKTIPCFWALHRFYPYFSVLQ